MCPEAECASVEPSFPVCPLVCSLTSWPHIDRIGYRSVRLMAEARVRPARQTFRRRAAVVWKRGGRKKTLKMCTVSHTLLLFIGILGPPTFLLRRLIAAGCAALHTRGKHNSSYLSKPFLCKGMCWTVLLCTCFQRGIFVKQIQSKNNKWLEVRLI